LMENNSPLTTIR